MAWTELCSCRLGGYGATVLLFFSGVNRKCPQDVALQVGCGEEKAVTWVESDKLLESQT